MWCVAELDEEYIAKMEDVLALYEKPYRCAEPVVCLDEKPVSLHADVRPCRPVQPGHIMDNLNIHCRKSLTDHLGQQHGRYLWSRLKVHYTPKHGSWLNQAEIELSLVSRQCLGSRRIPRLDVLQSEILSWNATANRDKTHIQWKFTRKAARTKFGYKKNTSKRSKT